MSNREDYSSWNEDQYEYEQRRNNIIMEEKNKYYIPELSDMYIGYEYERAIVIGIGREFEKDGMYPVEGWEKAIVNIEEENDRDVVTIPHDTYTKYYRTKYLDKEDIESLGWTNIRDVERWMGKPPMYYYMADYKNAMLGYNPEDHTIVITYRDPCKSIDGKEDEYNYPETKYGQFRGECKSINELKKLMQWLNIK